MVRVWGVFSPGPKTTTTSSLEQPMGVEASFAQRWPFKEYYHE
jgi:hypothetical protein